VWTLSVIGLGPVRPGSFSPRWATYRSYSSACSRCVPVWLTSVSHVVGSTSLFMTITNTIIAGTLGALIADVSGGGPAAVSIIGVIAGVGYLAAMLEIGRRSFGRDRVDTRFPSRG
jgi:hypothetical protein